MSGTGADVFPRAKNDQSFVNATSPRYWLSFLKHQRRSGIVQRLCRGIGINMKHRGDIALVDFPDKSGRQTSRTLLLRFGADGKQGTTDDSTANLNSHKLPQA